MAGAATTLMSASTHLTLHLTRQTRSKLPSVALICTNHPPPPRNRSTSCYGHGKIDGIAGEEIADRMEELVEDEEEEEEETSVDLLVRLMQNMFRGVSKQAKKALVSVLPSEIPSHLVTFAVDGLLLLTVLSIIKSLLEVACSLGGTVLALVLFLRLICTVIIPNLKTSNHDGVNDEIPSAT